MSIEYIRLAIHIVMFFGLLCMFMLIPLFMDVVERIDELKKLDGVIGITDFGIKKRIYIDLMLFTGFFDMFLGFTWASNIRLVFKARQEYISQCEKNQAGKLSLSLPKEE